VKGIRKDNSGFSLVELIVVVLIMAIIAVALAPQIMKWVGNSRTSADMSLKAHMKAAMTVTITGEDVIQELASSGGAKLEVTNSGTELTVGGGTPNDPGTKTYQAFISNLEESGDYTTLKTKSPDTRILIEINTKPYITKAIYTKVGSSIEIEELD